MRRPVLLRELPLLVMATLAVPGSARPAAYDPLDIKAALIGKVADFIRWPPDAGLDDPDRPFELVVLGRTTLAPRIEELFERRRVKIAGRRVWVRHADEPRDIGRAHLLFVGAVDARTLQRTVAALAGRAVLVVGESADFCQRGGAVNLFQENDRVRFQLSRAALRRHRLQAGYQLLAIARLCDEGKAAR